MNTLGVFFWLDRDNPGSGWICVWEYVEGKRTAKPLDYIKRNLWRGEEPLNAPAQPPASLRAEGK